MSACSMLPTYYLFINIPFLIITLLTLTSGHMARLCVTVFSHTVAGISGVVGSQVSCSPVSCPEAVVAWIASNIARFSFQLSRDNDIPHSSSIFLKRKSKHQNQKSEKVIIK